MTTFRLRLIRSYKRAYHSFSNLLILNPMNTFFRTLVLALSVSLTTVATPIDQPGKKSPPTQLARFEVGAYLTTAGTKLRLNVDKQLGGQVFVQLIDQKSNLYFDRTLSALDTSIRFSLDLSELLDGDYKLRVSNGLEVVVRELKIISREPVIAPRFITVL